MKREMTSALSVALQEYLSNSNAANRISEAEARRLGGVKLERDFTFETIDERFSQDLYQYLGRCSLEVELKFSEIFMEHQIIAFTGYTVTELPQKFGKTFRVKTTVVQATNQKWNS